MILGTGPSGLILPGQVRPILPKYLAVPLGLVGYWPLGFDVTDFTANKAFDISGNANTGTMTSLTASLLVNGPVGGGLNINSAGSIALPNLALGNGPFSITAWVNPTTTGTTGTFIGWGSGSNIFQFEMNVLAAGYIDAAFNNGGVYAYYSGPLTINTWNFIAVAFKGGAVTSANVLFFEGITGFQNATLSGSGSANLTDTSYTIGASSNLSQKFPGSMAEVRTYNRALEAGEMLQIFQAGLAGMRASPTSWFGELETFAGGLPIVSHAVIRKTLSEIGGRVGTRQVQGWG